jgi:hypothetical protein
LFSSSSSPSSSPSSSSPSSSTVNPPGYSPATLNAEAVKMSREEALHEILAVLPQNAAIVGSTGFPSREIFEVRENLRK